MCLHSPPLRQRSGEEHLSQHSHSVPNGPERSASKSNTALPLLLAEGGSCWDRWCQLLTAFKKSQGHTLELDLWAYSIISQWKTEELSKTRALFFLTSADEQVSYVTLCHPLPTWCMVIDDTQSYTVASLLKVEKLNFIKFQYIWWIKAKESCWERQHLRTFGAWISLLTLTIQLYPLLPQEY